MSIAVVKEPSIFREGLIRILSNEFPTKQIVGIDPAKISSIRGYYVDICIVDIDTKNNILEETKQHISHFNDIVIWTEDENHPELPTLFSENAIGFFHSEMSGQELTQAMHLIFNGGTYAHGKFAPQLLHCYRKELNRVPLRPIGLFTNREWGILELLIDGCSNQQISKSLYITEKTVKNHVSSILRKLDVPDRTNAVITALKNEWFYLS